MSTETGDADDRRTAIRERHREAAEEHLPEHLDLLVGGEWVDAASGERFATTDPTTGEVLAEVPAGASEDIDRAVDAAEAAFEDEWSGYGVQKRQSLLHELADRVEAEKETLATLESLDMGKPISEAGLDIDMVADHFRYFAAATRTNEGATVPSDGTRHVQTIREPHGVVGAIVPWNFPTLIASWKLAPALAGGNTVVLKPAEETPLTALKLAEIADDVLPEGVVNVVTGFGEEAGEPLTTHEGVDKLSFTGSTEVGKTVMKNAADNVTDVSLELGGKGPFVVFPDADLDQVLFNAHVAIFYNTGEQCTAGSRMFVHEDVKEEFVEKFTNMAKGVAVGDPLDENVRMGPKASQEQLDRCLGYIDVARDDGGQVLVGGGPPDDEALADGAFVEPTIIEGLDHDSRAVQEEIFGPVVEIFEWDDYDEMMGLANDVDYGLAAGVMTDDITKAYRAAKDLEVGNVWVNTYNNFVAGQPFGGYKESGIGREQARETLDQYTQTKTINVSLR